jgi:hypothetical protein
MGIEKKEWIFLLVILGWIILWSVFFLPNFNNYLISHPDFEVWKAFLLKESGYFISFIAIGWILTKEVPHSLRLGFGVMLGLMIFNIAIPPQCVNLQGNPLITGDNATCKASDDYFMSWIFNNFFHVSYGTKTIYYLTYVGGTMICAVGAVLLLKQKELWEELFDGVFG